MGAGDHEARGDDMERKADKKLSGWGLFGSQYAAAADLYYKAATFFKLAKSWSRAASVYTKIANCHLKLDSKDEAASAYADAANCYKKFSPQEAARALDQAVNHFLEVGRLAMAARYCKDAGVIYQQEQDLEMASDCLEKAADLFAGEGQTSQSNGIKHEIAEIAAQLEQYPKAAEIFEEIARQSIKSKLLKCSVRAVLVNAGICQLCIADAVAMQKSLARYQEIDPTFSGTREHKLLADLAASMDDGDVARFTAAIEKFDGITRLDPWRMMLLLRAKDELKKQEDDLT